MSLRIRLIGLVAIAFVISIVCGGVIVSLIASRSVQTEMDAALLVGRQAVQNALEDIRNSPDPQADLESFIASFAGNRHLRVSWTENTATVAAPANERSPFGRTPDWLTRLIGVAPETDRISIALAGHSAGTIVIETDPTDAQIEMDGFSVASPIVIEKTGKQHRLIVSAPDHVSEMRMLDEVDATISIALRTTESTEKSAAKNDAKTDAKKRKKKLPGLMEEDL